MATAGNVARIVQLNGGRIIGKTRLQKTAYFLEATGLGFAFDFEYHHYGPYSEELAHLADDARALGFLDVEWHTSQDGAEYAVFVAKSTANASDDEDSDELRKKVLQVLRNYSAVELELAATAHFLENNGYSDQAWNETRQRKASKISSERIARAKQLLGALDEAVP